MSFRWWRRGLRRREEDLDEEIRRHFAMARRDREARGESAEEAEWGARREFGNEGLVKEVTREMWGWTRLARFGQDARYGLRSLRRDPAFAPKA
jgi:hypothetical protein